MSRLYIVATPIGNLADMTYRAVKTLKNVDLIACEDTRVSKKLLDNYDINTKTVSYHQHSRKNKIDFLIKQLRENKDIAVITDAGTPGISDPGNKLVSEVVKKLSDEVKVIAIPGASAVVAALSISGLPTDKFLFLGFLPHKKGKQTVLKQIADSQETIVFYESPHRILKTLTVLNELLDNSCQVVVARELTKKFESIYRGNISRVLGQLKNDKVKGEFVIIVG